MRPETLEKKDLDPKKHYQLDVAKGAKAHETLTTLTWYPELTDLTVRLHNGDNNSSPDDDLIICWMKKPEDVTHGGLETMIVWQSAIASVPVLTGGISTCLKLMRDMKEGDIDHETLAKRVDNLISMCERILGLVPASFAQTAAKAAFAIPEDEQSGGAS